ncbi:TPA: DNA/RNA helicase domain-containing protein [Campylobacter jejuni]
MKNLLTIYNLHIDKISYEAIIKLLKLPMKKYELETLLQFCKLLDNKAKYRFNIFENYYIGYKLPHLEKEFDLIKSGNNLIVNIELKSDNINQTKILSQLKRNYYYLSMLNKEVICCAYVKSNNSLYSLKDNELIKIDIENLINYLEQIQNPTKNLNELFSPINFLISPFNNADNFIANKYYLTQQQEEIKNDILKKITNNSINSIFSIEGAAGTGKTLLVYDIARNIDKVCIVHCAQSNDGIDKLKKQKWNIITIKDFNKDSIENYNVIIVDEAQRVSLGQIDQFILAKKIIIFSHDVNQKLNNYNDALKTVTKIKDIPNIKKYQLSSKIRHNKELASFIYQMFNLKKINKYKNHNYDYKNVIIHFENNLINAEKYVKHLKHIGYEHIYLTNSLHTKETLDRIKFSSNISAHKSIGQEYDNVLVIIDEYFYYKDNKLYYNKNTHYNAIETLFQAMSRVRKKLFILIISNQEIYENCMKIKNNI